MGLRINHMWFLMDFHGFRAHFPGFTNMYMMGAYVDKIINSSIFGESANEPIAVCAKFP